MGTEKIAILFNPSAGKGKALREKEQMEKSLRRLEIPYDLFVSESEENLRELAKRNSEKYRILVGVGGDSTFNIIVNEIRKAGATVNFGMIGLGSSNDITKEFDLDSLEKSCQALKRGRTKRIDLGYIAEDKAILRYFLGQANIGLGVMVNKHVEELGRRKPGLAKKQTLAGVLAVIDSYRSKKIPIPLTIESEKDRVEGEFILTIFSNIRYWATGRKIAPFALPDDGMLDGCLIHKCNFPRLISIALLARAGKHSKAKEVRMLQSPYFEISSQESFKIQTDGEIVGGLNGSSCFKKIQIKIIPQALILIC